MASKSKILFIGGTGNIGKFFVEASAKAGHPTFVLIRESTLSNHAKAKIVDNFKSLGATLVHGDVYDHESLVKAIKEVDVVISTVASALLGDQTKIIAAIKEAGSVKRFFPSEFGNDVDRVHPVEPAKTAFEIEAGIRRVIEAEGIPYTSHLTFSLAISFQTYRNQEPLLHPGRKWSSLVTEMPKLFQQGGHWHLHHQSGG